MMFPRFEVQQDAGGFVQLCAKRQRYTYSDYILLLSLGMAVELRLEDVEAAGHALPAAGRIGRCWLENAGDGLRGYCRSRSGDNREGEEPHCCGSLQGERMREERASA